MQNTCDADCLCIDVRGRKQQCPDLHRLATPWLASLQGHKPMFKPRSPWSQANLARHHSFWKSSFTPHTSLFPRLSFFLLPWTCNHYNTINTSLFLFPSSGLLCFSVTCVPVCLDNELHKGWGPVGGFCLSGIVQAWDRALHTGGADCRMGPHFPTRFDPRCSDACMWYGAGIIVTF